MFIPTSLEDLQRIVGERLEETTQLEFKRQLPESGKNDDLARDMCAMANTEGGVIIYGIAQDEMGRADSLASFPLRGAAERVSLVARSSLDEPLELTDLKVIESQSGQGFLIVVIPQSRRAPHFHQATAWGRTPKGNTVLTRRRIGELFARSPGFSEEFSLIIRKLGRVSVKQVVESYIIEIFSGHQSRQHDYFLVFGNDGESDVFDASWEWVPKDKNANLPTVPNDPFPIRHMPYGAQVRLMVWGILSELNIRTRWKDEAGREYEQLWPIG